MASVAAQLAETIGRTVEGLGYEYVDAERLGGGLLRVTIDRAEGIGVADCERVSRQLTHLFAVEDVEYARLEVSSPGLDRPLKRAQDYARFAGHEVQVQLHAPLAAAGGRKRLHGRLLGLAGAVGAEQVRLELAPEPAPKAGTGSRAVRRKPAGARAGRSSEPAAGVIVEFGLGDVDKAKLVPELNFRGGSKE
jgi:ribosome maturation factor RimP